MSAQQYVFPPGERTHAVKHGIGIVRAGIGKTETQMRRAVELYAKYERMNKNAQAK